LGRVEEGHVDLMMVGGGRWQIVSKRDDEQVLAERAGPYVHPHQARASLLHQTLSTTNGLVDQTLSSKPSISPSLPPPWRPTMSRCSSLHASPINLPFPRWPNPVFPRPRPQRPRLSTSNSSLVQRLLDSNPPSRRSSSRPRPSHSTVAAWRPLRTRPSAATATGEAPASTPSAGRDDRACLATRTPTSLHPLRELAPWQTRATRAILASLACRPPRPPQR
jgi:hypothetical protein